VLLWLGGCALPIIGAPASFAERDAARAQAGLATSGSRPPPPLPADADSCYGALRSQGVRFTVADPAEASGVAMPTRLQGPLGAVTVRSRGGDGAALLDCRLALGLLRWEPWLRRAGVVAIEHVSVYRPGARTRRRGRVSGHARGLAIDAARFVLEDGARLDVLEDWENRERGRAPCLPDRDEGRAARRLRALVCDAVEQRLFQVVLTPHHDRAHADHVHLELKPEVAWTYVR